jgi:hypothetical protein
LIPASIPAATKRIAGSSPGKVNRRGAHDAVVARPLPSRPAGEDVWSHHIEICIPALHILLDAEAGFEGICA